MTSPLLGGIHGNTNWISETNPDADFLYSEVFHNHHKAIIKIPLYSTLPTPVFLYHVKKVFLSESIRQHVASDCWLYLLQR